VFLRRGEGSGERPPHELADEPVWAAGLLAGVRDAQLGAGAPWDVFDAKALALVAIRAVGGRALGVHVSATSTVAYLHPASPASCASTASAIRSAGSARCTRRCGRASASTCRCSRSRSSWRACRSRAPRRCARSRGSRARPATCPLLLAADILAARVQATIEAANEPLVSSVRLLEDYRDAKLGAGMKSMLWSIAYRAPDRTLTDVEVDRAHETIVGRLVENLGAQRR